MAGEGTKSAVAHARVYFAVRAREAELGALTVEEMRQTALARAREMTDYKIFRDMMVENATDYEPSTKATRIFFGAMQNKLYRHITGLSGPELKNARKIYQLDTCRDRVVHVSGDRAGEQLLERLDDGRVVGVGP